MTMFLSDKNNIKEVLLFPAMKPDESDPQAGATFRAAKALAGLQRQQEAAKKTNDALALLPEAVMKVEKALAGAGSLGFVKGAAPSGEDAQAFEAVSAVVAVAGGKMTAESLPVATRAWFNILKVFGPEVRASWK